MASVPLAQATQEHIARHGAPDVVVASDMVDLAGFLGLCRSELVGVPAVVYFHENQLTQPTSPNGVGGLRIGTWHGPPGAACWRPRRSGSTRPGSGTR
ncbi:MAG: DUF3524 domain-containing protein [Microthrixaceae bacterium]